MHLLAAVRGFSAVLLGGTLVGFVPQIESPVSIVAWQASTQSLDDGLQPSACAWNAPDLALIDSDDAEAPDGDFDQDHQPRRPLNRIRAMTASQESAPPQVQLAAAEDAVKGAQAKPKERVKAEVFLSVDKLPAGGKCRFAAVLKIDEGWHLYGNPAGDDALIPTTVTIQSKQKLEQLDTEYPKGESKVTEEFDNPLSIYKGTVTIRGEIEAPSSAAGKMDELEFQIDFQICNDQTCVRKKLKLKDKIEIVKPGTPIKQINQKYFTEKKPSGNK